MGGGSVTYLGVTVGELVGAFRDRYGARDSQELRGVYYNSGVANPGKHTKFVPLHPPQDPPISSPSRMSGSWFGVQSAPERHEV